MITKFGWMGPLAPQKFSLPPGMPVAEMHGIGPGFVSVTFAAVTVKADNDEKYVIGG